MATHAIKKVSCEATGYSVVDLNDVSHVFVAAAPRWGGKFRQQVQDALLTLEMVVREENAHNAIVHQAVFLADMSHLEECRQIIHSFYDRDLPATSYIPQAPCAGKMLAIEALGLGQRKGEVTIERVNEQLVISRHNGIAWAHCAQVLPQPHTNGLYGSALDAFDQIRTLLASANFRFDQVIRTWLYLGGIVEGEGSAQRYRELNRARSDFYKKIPFLAERLPKHWAEPVYPASTGIGTDGRGVMMSAIALATERPDIVAVPLENPRQTAAYEYGPHYSPRSPKFSRAMALSCGDYATLFISGTASITESETRHEEDAAAQTEETLNNIAALISEENLSKSGLPGLGSSLHGLAFARVYVKRQSDYAAVRAVCERRLGELPTIYAVADVCRPELLVEIEGVAFSRKAPAGIIV
jgi:enamine deaminase RidA (YjgF/YER057c/UK114 family)